MNGPDPARETAREDPLGQRVARLLGYYGVDVQGGNLAPDRHVCDELLAIGNEAAELRAQLTAARARAERAEGALQCPAEWCRRALAVAGPNVHDSDKPSGNLTFEVTTSRDVAEQIAALAPSGPGGGVGDAVP